MIENRCTRQAPPCGSARLVTLYRRIMMRPRRACVHGLGIAALLTMPVAARAQEARVRVGPNILVSQDGNAPHVELMVAAHPTNRKNLLGAAITFTGSGQNTACKTYASTDGGITWLDSSFPEQREFGGADPQVAYGLHGTALFAGLDFAKDETGRQRGWLRVWRSEDGGLTWQKPAVLGYSYDHEQIVVDHTAGKYASRIYLGVLYGYPLYTVGVFRSEDDGRTWIGPVAAASGKGIRGINVTNLLLFSDGTLFVPYSDFDFHQDRPHTAADWHSAMAFVTSSDGGVTFSEPKPIQTQMYDSVSARSRLGGSPVYAVDHQGEKYRDRLYVAWPDPRFGKFRILFSYSTDRGHSWSAARVLDPSVPKTALQYQPMIAVNRTDGTVGVTWFDTRDGGDGVRYDEYFAASVDGGASFLPPVRVSSESSSPLGAGNLALTLQTLQVTPDSLRLSFFSAGSRWVNGGDYMGLTADVAGTFHPFWADSRTGTFQIYTAEVRVTRPDMAATHAEKPKVAPPLQVRVRDVTKQIQVVSDPLMYDAGTKELRVPLRIRNTSEKPLYAPIRLAVLGFGTGAGNIYREYAPTVLDTANGKQGIGATVDFTSAVGTEGVLLPGQQTGPVVLRLRLVDPLKVPAFHVLVTAGVAEEQP